MNCPVHKIPMIRRKSKFGKGNYWWGCPKYPDCRITCAEHPNGEVMSTLADQDLKDLRKKAHVICEEIWDKKDMYEWMKANTEKGHIGLMNKEELEDLIEKVALL